MRRVWAVAAWATLFIVSPGAFAADPSAPASMGERFYLSFHGGSVLSAVADDTATKPANTTFVTQAVAKPGYIVGAAAGKRFGDNFSLEGEINYAAAAIDHANAISPVPGDVPATGSGSTITGMVNAYLSLQTGQIMPYVGAGLGVGYFTASKIESAGATLNGSDIGLAYQLMAGVNFDATQTTSVGARYRYVKVTDLSLMDGGYRHDFSTAAQSVELVLTHHFPK